MSKQLLQVLLKKSMLSKKTILVLISFLISTFHLNDKVLGDTQVTPIIHCNFDGNWSECRVSYPCGDACYCNATDSTCWINDSLLHKK